MQIERTNPSNAYLLAFTEDPDHLIGYAKLRTGATDPSVQGDSLNELHRLHVDRAAIGLGIGSALTGAP